MVFFNKTFGYHLLLTEAMFSVFPHIYYLYSSFSTSKWYNYYHNFGCLFFPMTVADKETTLHCIWAWIKLKNHHQLTCPILSRFRLWGDLWFLMILHGRCFSNMHNCWKYDQLSSTIITLIRPLNSFALVLCPIKALKKEPTTMLHSSRSTAIIEKIRKVKKRGGKHFFFKSEKIITATVS